MSCSVHDMAALERRGIPTTTICTQGFMDAGREKAAMLGMPELRLVSIPFPFASLSPDEARQRGREAIDLIITALTASDSG